MSMSMYVHLCEFMSIHVNLSHGTTKLNHKVVTTIDNNIKILIQRNNLLLLFGPPCEAKPSWLR